MPYRHHPRPWNERAGDEVKSWFGDRGAEARRDRDERQSEEWHDRERASWYDWREDVPPQERSRSWRDRPWSSAGDWPMTGPHLGKGPRNHRRGDDRIREDICEELTASGDVDATEIEVEVLEGEVTLNGSVDSRAAKREAEDLVYRIPGVRDVYNRIKVVSMERYNAAGTGGSSGALNAGPGGAAGPLIWK
jgi:hypothetical protein